jgi:hypothetical protein
MKLDGAINRTLIREIGNVYKYLEFNLGLKSTFLPRRVLEHLSKIEVRKKIVFGHWTLCIWTRIRAISVLL